MAGAFTSWTSSSTGVLSTAPACCSAMRVQESDAGATGRMQAS